MPHSIEMRHIRKYFDSSGVLACDDVNFSVTKGEVHALVGENGAGKSTLIKIVSGVVTADSGTINIDGQPTVIHSPKDAATSAAT